MLGAQFVVAFGIALLDVAQLGYSRKSHFVVYVMRWEMDALLLLLGRVAGIGGLLLCITAVVLRLAGKYYLGTFQLATLLQGGMAATVLGCFFLLLALTAQGKAGRSFPRE
jgi:hypothetical protein